MSNFGLGRSRIIALTFRLLPLHPVNHSRGPVSKARRTPKGFPGQGYPGWRSVPIFKVSDRIAKGPLNLGVRRS